MLREDEDALICDLAEYYRIYDYKSFQSSYIATLAIGLSDESRSKKRMSGASLSPDIYLLAAILDQVNLLIWMQTKDASRGANRPRSILSTLYGNDKTSTSSFNSGEEFEEARKRLLIKCEGGE